MLSASQLELVWLKKIMICAGVSSLSAGCHAQMSEVDTEIFEMHNLPGGQCTAWSRGGLGFSFEPAKSQPFSYF